MVDVQCNDQKLAAEAIRIVMQATDCGEQFAVDALSLSSNKANLLYSKFLINNDITTCENLLKSNAGNFLRKR